MAGLRPAVFGGRFYPAEGKACARVAEALLRDVAPPVGPGAIVPHAGWAYSGPTAALGIAGVARGSPGTIVIFGAVHGPDDNYASVYAAGGWATPLGEVEVDAELAGGIIHGGLVEAAAALHEGEHSIEVQLPLLKWLLPRVRIVPVMVRPSARAAEVGRHCARAVAESGRTVGFLGSTDLTHYGPAFGFEPAGRGWVGIRWAKDVNDRRLVRLMAGMEADGVVQEAEANRNACGSGAVAATVAAMVELGATRYVELRHTCSAEVEAADDPEPLNSVGYEAGVFIRP